MDVKESSKSTDLLSVQPNIKNAQLLVNKKLNTLDDLRQNFKNMPCSTSVLSQVKQFLPQIATANDELERKLKSDPSFSADIEAIDDDSQPHIEMNIALIDQQYSEDSDLDSELSDSDIAMGCGPVTEDNIKLPIRKIGHGKQLVEQILDVKDVNCDTD
ncbi:NOP protein chaperone 1-like [Dreissena polymorpha]|uniref:Uncharacterized protein n=1 Tax=Dreissena polymorpha TaxID=45954 RepID=A0A9D4GRS2_DREPO|nr:NOP protein chaperone 1-like [Dreissena polymorpha]KAH3820301.1 hypothetical protein DPMN_122047 [Dreissena polymorpha]